jgi:hypothetical protein
MVLKLVCKPLWCIHILVIWVTIPFWTLGKYQHFGETQCLHLQSEEGVCSSKMLASTYQTAQCQNPENHNINLHHWETLNSFKPLGVHERFQWFAKKDPWWNSCVSILFWGNSQTGMMLVVLFYFPVLEKLYIFVATVVPIGKLQIYIWISNVSLRVICQTPCTHLGDLEWVWKQ